MYRIWGAFASKIYGKTKAQLTNVKELSIMHAGIIEIEALIILDVFANVLVPSKLMNL